MHRWLRERLRGARGSNFAERNHKWPYDQATSDRQRALPIRGSSTALSRPARGCGTSGYRFRYILTESPCL